MWIILQQTIGSRTSTVYTVHKPYSLQQGLCPSKEGFLKKICTLSIIVTFGEEGLERDVNFIYYIQSHARAAL